MIRYASLACLLAGGSAAAAPPASGRDPQAMAALDKMGAYLRTLTTMRIVGEIATDDVVGDGQKVQYTGTAEVTVRRPDGMRAVVATDREHQQMYYDGKQFTLYQPTPGYYASFPAPPTLAGLVDVAEKRYGIDLPLVDLFAWGTERSHPQDILSATRIGTSAVKGTPCEHYAFHQADVDWQLWIQQGERPLPRKLVITTTSERSQPQYSVVYTWDLSPQIPPQYFTFTAPPGAQRIEFETVAQPGVPRLGRPAPKQPRGGTP